MHCCCCCDTEDILRDHANELGALSVSCPAEVATVLENHLIACVVKQWFADDMVYAFVRL
jgi:hypothetical protein